MTKDIKCIQVDECIEEISITYGECNFTKFLEMVNHLNIGIITYYDNKYISCFDFKRICECIENDIKGEYTHEIFRVGIQSIKCY